MSKSARPRITRPIAELNGPAILLQELVADEGVDRVMRAIERGPPDLRRDNRLPGATGLHSTSSPTGDSIRILSSGRRRNGCPEESP